VTDQDIIQLIRQGQDQKAFARLYTHFGSVQRLVKANSGSRDDAKDVFQDALIIFHRKARGDDFVLTCAVSTYLFSICRNLWREELRRRNRSLTRWEVEDMPVEEADVTAMLAREGEYSTAEQALRTLGDKCLELLKRFYLSKESLLDIARSLGFAGEGAAKTRKYKCL
jgi:RNA polymerase sigma factor (sigma-70 family)